MPKGGLARRASYIYGERAYGEPLLVLDAGNALYATYGPIQATQGQAAIEAMNMMGYDAIALGDEDLLLGAETLRKRMAEASFPVLSANVIDTTTNQPLAPPYVIKEIAGRRVGIIGVTGLSTSAPTDPGDGTPTVAPAILGTTLRVLNPVETVQRYAAEVAELADIVILLSHVGLPLDRAISAKVPEIDVIIGGQTRSVIAPTQADTAKAVIAQAGYRGEWIGSLMVQFDSQGEVVSFGGETVALTEEVGEDPAMAAFVAKIKKGQ